MDPAKQWRRLDWFAFAQAEHVPRLWRFSSDPNIDETRIFLQLLDGSQKKSGSNDAAKELQLKREKNWNHLALVEEGAWLSTGRGQGQGLTEKWMGVSVHEVTHTRRGGRLQDHAGRRENTTGTDSLPAREEALRGKLAADRPSSRTVGPHRPTSTWPWPHGHSEWIQRLCGGSKGGSGERRRDGGANRKGNTSHLPQARGHGSPASWSGG